MIKRSTKQVVGECNDHPAWPYSTQESLTFDNDRSLSFLSLFLPSDGRVGRLIWSIDAMLDRRSSVTEELGDVLVLK